MLLSCENWSKSFGNNSVFKDLSFSIKQKECVCIIGESGSGKSTFLRTLNFLEKVDSGSLSFNQSLVSTKKEISQLRRSVTMVFQNYALWSHLTAQENISLVLRSQKKLIKSEADDIALESLKQVGLSDRAHHYPHQLSGGQQQRVGLARAFSPDPELILLDEPTSSLDPNWVSEVEEVIIELKSQKRSLILASHSPKLVGRLADRIFQFKDQKLISVNKDEYIGALS